MNASVHNNETFFINRSILGWHLVPADADHHPLLLKLLGGDAELVGKALEWDSLEDGLVLVRSEAAYYGLVATICGNRKVRPVVKLRLATPKPSQPTPIKVFSGLHGSDAAKWGVTDFYEDYEQALKAAIATGLPFDTGWYSVKKEIQSGRISRAKTNGPITVEGSVSMDDGSDLLDTAFWKAAGGNQFCDSGWDALTKIGMSEQQIYDWLDDLTHHFGIGDTSRADFNKLHWRTGYAGICRALDALVSELEDSLEREFDSIVASCREMFLHKKEEHGASCTNCKHFSPGIHEGRNHPADPADCTHPKLGSLLSVNKHFPFQNGCKHWIVKS